MTTMEVKKVFSSEKLLCALILLIGVFHCGGTDSTSFYRDDNDASSDINRIFQSLNLKASFQSWSDKIFKNTEIDKSNQQREIISPGSIPEARTFLTPNQIGDRDKTSSSVGEDPDAKKDVLQLASSLGYPAQNFTVKTHDGFLLTLHRIPYGRKGGNITRPSIFLQHGLLSSAADWVINFPNDSLAFVLADNGYDVWMGNSRGNTYSSRHVSLKPDDEKFWDWSFDEMAKYDTTAFIDFILNKTGEPSLYYVGHSQGTMMAFALFSSIPEYQKKIRLFVGLAPIISMNYMKSPLSYLSFLSDQEAFAVFGRKQFLTSSVYVKGFADTFCNKPLIDWVCADIVFVLCGHDTSNLNKTRLTVYMNHTPAGTSAKNMVHFAQFIRSQKFSMFDYGSPSENLKHYGQTTPPAYNASLITAPALLFTATNDWIADPKDVQILESTLPNIVAKYNIPEWNHLDFVWGLDAADKCYGDILEWLRKY